MIENKTSMKLIYAVVGSIITWTALAVQFYLILLNRAASVAETVIRFFSFFTVLINILVGICFIASLFKQSSFFTRPKILTAIAVYISIVGLVYNLILRSYWAPVGLNKLADELLHVIVPVTFLLYWIFFVPKKPLAWLNTINWLALPAIYLIYTFVRGHYFHYYPYPFINVTELGYSTALINSALVCAAFLAVSIIFIGITRLGNKKTTV